MSSTRARPESGSAQISSDRRRATLVLGGIAAGATAALALIIAAALVVTVPPATRLERPATTATPTEGDLRWVDVGGVAVPVSERFGPTETSGDRAARYSRNKHGAAMAAVNVLIRTSANSGPRAYGPIFAEQMTGANLPAMKLVTAGLYEQLRVESDVEPGEPVPARDTRVAGYVVTKYDGGERTASVDVVVSAVLDGARQLVSFDVELRWANGDWRVVAPPHGDWGDVAHFLTSEPAGMATYYEIANDAAATPTEGA